MKSSNPRAPGRSVPVPVPSLPTLGKCRFAVRRKLVHVALQARTPVATRLVGSAEFLKVGATGLAQARMPAFTACLSATAVGMGFAAHGGQAKEGDEEDG